MTHLAVLASFAAWAQATVAASATSELASLWEIAKGIMLFVSTSLLAWIATTLRRVEQTLVKHEHILIGVDGKNGLRSKVAHNDERLDALEKRNIAIDAVAEAERDLHPGPDRRHDARRLRDKIHAAHDSDEYPTEDT